jgi:hypothetical protein
MIQEAAIWGFTPQVVIPASLATEGLGFPCQTIVDQTNPIGPSKP